MTPEEHNGLRVRACTIIRELGACLDALGNAAETQRLPGDDPAAEALIVHQHLDEAANALDTLCTHAGDMVADLDRLVTRADLAAAPFLERGAPFDETLPRQEGGAS